MIVVDNALKARAAEGRPLRVAMAGAGYMARGIALQFMIPIEGMRLVAIAGQSIGQAESAYREAGVDELRAVRTVAELEDAIERGQYAITDDPMLLCEAGNVDILIEVSGTVEHGAHVALKAIEHAKHLVLFNAELDATVGPMLKVYADRNGVVVTNTDGDEPGVAMNLYRFVKTAGFRPLLAGNFKGMLDRYRTPDTQKAFADKYRQKARMVTSFADGTKLSMEATILANATGFRVGQRGMYGPKCNHVKDALKLYSLDQLLQGGLVDFILGAEPHTGAFVLGYEDHPVRQQYLNYFKMGEGPLYAFYTPYHLPHIQVVTTVARAALLHDATVAPLGKPVCEVLTVAKRDLKAGEVLDGIGGFTCYGTIDNSEVVQRENLLPMGLSQHCRLLRDIPKDQAIGYADVELPAGRLSDRLRAEQNAYFMEAVHV